MCRDNGKHCERNPSASGKVMTSHGSHRCRSQHVLKAADTHGAALDATQPGVIQQGCDLARIDVTMTMKVTEDAALVLGARKVGYQHAPSRFEHTPDFIHTLLTDLPRQVVEHQCAQHCVELGAGKRQRLGDGVLELDVESCLHRL